MNTEQKILLLDQVKALSNINQPMIEMLKVLSQADFDKVREVILKILEAGDLINQIGSEPSVNIQIQSPCLS